MIRKQLLVINRLGIHARAAAKLVQLSSQFSSKIEVGCNGQSADGKSIMGVMMLAASKGTYVDVQVHGDDEEKAMMAIEQLFADKFCEER